MGLFGGKKNDNDKQSAIKSNVPGRSCLDCRYCNMARADRKRSMIYCDWDSEYYYPETGNKCTDFKN